MSLSEKVSFRLKRIYVGIAMGIAIWLLYASFSTLNYSIRTNTSMGSVEFVLTPISLNHK